jgi:hypothetical protein
MTPADLQTWLNAHGQCLAVDGKIGPASQAAIVAVFTNRNAAAVTDSQIAAYALRLGCTVKQLRAVAKVESGGSAFDNAGRPKILFERHIFHRLTDGRWDGSSFSNAAPGGYDESSWSKLTQAAAKDHDAAFSSISIGKFQIMGSNWHALGYASPLEMAYSASVSEAGSYDMLARFIEANGLKAKLQAISTNPATCRPFAASFNGPGYERFSYHSKIADAMR